MALTENGRVYSWGNGQGGKLGHGSHETSGKSVPTKIMDSVLI